MTFEEAIDPQVWAEGLHPFDGLGEVVVLFSFQLERRDVESFCVEGTVLVSDQDNALEAMDVDQESELLGDCLFFAKLNKVLRQARGSAGHRKSIVARQLQQVLHEVVKLFAEAAVAAIDSGGADSFVVEPDPTREVVDGCVRRPVHWWWAIRAVAAGDG